MKNNRVKNPNCGNFEASCLQVQHSKVLLGHAASSYTWFLDCKVFKKSGSYGQFRNDSRKKVDLSNYRLYVNLCLIMTQSGKINSYLCAKMGNRLIYFLVKDPYIVSPPSI